MIKRTGKIISIAFILALSAIGLMAQNRPYNISDNEVRNIANRIQDRAEKMRDTLNNGSSQGGLRDSFRRNKLDGLLQDLGNKAYNLSDRASQRRATSSDAQEVLSKANKIDEQLRSNSSFSNSLRNDWSRLSSEVDKLARAFYLSWNGGNYNDGYDNNYPTYPQSGNNYPNYPDSRNNGFLIPDNTTVVATLNDDLNTKEMQEGQRFTMTVQSPSKYRGAVIEGYVSGVERSGKVSGRSQMTLNFRSIRTYNGTYNFSGTVEEVVDTNGKTIRVEEGSVKDNSRTKTTATRAGIGAGVGAIIGAIAGGGKGAAIGAIIGAGAGAGTTYIQGRDDLELTSGSQITIRSSAPSYRRKQ